MHWVALKFNDACFCQAEAVTPKRIKTGLGCNGLGLLPLWLFALCQFASSPSMCFDSGFSSLSIHGLRLQDVVDLMQCLLSGRFLGNHSFSCVLVC